MKNFLRTNAGKAILFLLLILSCVTAALFAIGKFVFYQSDLYLLSEEAFQEDYLSDMAASVSDDILWDYLSDDSGDLRILQRYYGEGRTNLLIRLHKVTLEGEEMLFTNTDHSFDLLEEKIFVVRPTENGQIGNMEILGSVPSIEELQENGMEAYHLLIGIDEDFPVSDRFSNMSRLIHLVYSLQQNAILIVVVCGIAAVVLFVFLMSVSAKRPGTEELFPGPLNRIPFDLITGAFGALLLFLVFLESEASYFIPTVLYVAAAAFLALCLFFGWCMSAAARIKQHTLITNTLCWKVLRFCWRSFRSTLRLIGSLLFSIPFLWKAYGALALFGAVELIALLGWSRFAILFLDVFGGLIAIYCVFAMWKLRTGAREISEGHYEKTIDEKPLIFAFREHARDLNRIREGLNVAVEDRLRSERMKTELITNVSHDIKTPLTSIINYSDLIEKEETENETITEYAGVLHRQSQKLKRLIDDLIEASKASTGNLEMNFEKCDLNVILSQVSGEYEERLQQADLSLVTKIPEETVPILADGRRLWRVFDNLMSNIIKYAMPGTRVYISMVRQNGEAILVFKNTSKDPLDLTPEELTERFVRGDASRNTEGNGLGLSIAKSLVELQHGDLNLYADGDLFKAILRFPLYNG